MLEINGGQDGSKASLDPGLARIRYRQLDRHMP
jgi:hypothetical protein